VSFAKTVGQLRLDLAQEPETDHMTGQKNTSGPKQLAVLPMPSVSKTQKVIIVDKKGSLTIPIPTPRSPIREAA